MDYNDDRHSHFFMMFERCRVVCLLLAFGCWTQGVTLRISAAEMVTYQDSPAFSTTTVESNAAFNVQIYVIGGNPLLSTNIVIPLLSKYTGTNVSLKEIVGAATALQSEYLNQGYPNMSIAFAPEQISNGIVTLNVFQAAFPQIVVAGNRFLFPGEVMSNSMAATVAAATNAASVVPFIQYLTPATPGEMAAAHAALLEKMTAVAAAEKDRRIHVVSTNAGPRFDVEKYLITGNSVLSPSDVAIIFTNIDGDFGTNVSFDAVSNTVVEFQRAYRERGYVTIAVGLPPQKLTNAMVKIQVTEGRLADINVIGNRYFSSNNVMRALPSLHPNTLLNGPIFQAELNRANASQDRQIYPLVLPGPRSGTSALQLKVKDRLPLHDKIELNNESAPGTPALRVNASAVADNLWQREESLGVQYGFSPELYKQGNWNFYDEPLVANYGAFYRLPLGNPEPVENIIAGNPGNFGYSEATRQFRLPPPSGQPELNLFVSRSTVDTGVSAQPPKYIVPPGGAISVSSSSAQESLTVNSDLGARLTIPAKSTTDFQSSFSGGPDFKTYDLNVHQTNFFYFTLTTVNPINPLQSITTTSTDASPNNAPPKSLEYLPLSLRYDATWRQPGVTYGFGLGISGNAWYSGSKTNLQGIIGSTESSGHWATLTPSLSADFTSPGGWDFSLHANGQWASEPLLSTEQFGIGGVNSVRGYHEGEVFGDTGWRVSLEQQTPPHIVGIVYGNAPLTIRGSIYMDSGKVYLLDPQGRPGDTALWSTGVGLAASAGPHWETRFLFSVPLIGTSDTPSYQPYFNFSLTTQF
jgi:hemolysin activation/secretion protein